MVLWIWVRRNYSWHKFFGKQRKRIGVEKIAELFNKIIEQLTGQGLIGWIFTFVDATAIISKISLWEERDRAIKEGLDKLNNSNVEKYSKDKDARFGCKGKSKFWFGYKRHLSVDTKQGIITKVEVTLANGSDFKVLPKLLPQTGMILADKGYDTSISRETLSSNKLHL